MNEQFKIGLRRGIPIGLGYLPVSFAFGMTVVGSGVSVWQAFIISLTCLTSAGQFAGTNLIINGATLIEIALATLVINIRYTLMSLSISQKLKMPIPLYQRLIIAFGITDETFTLAMLKKGEITYKYWLGFLTLPYLGWSIGTLLGAVMTTLLPQSVQQCLTIALYAMFIALLVPDCKRSKSIAIVVAFAIMLSCLLNLIHITSGFNIIIVSVVSAVFGAVFFPREVQQ